MLQVDTDGRLSAQFPILRFFRYAHLPSGLANVSEPFCKLAFDLAERHAGPQLMPGSHAEVAAALRKLLEAKDCAVRAVLP